MAAPQSTPLPEAPTRGEAEGQFVPKANAFVGALEPFRQQLQAQADFVNERSTETEENAALAQDASEMALSSANFAGDWSGLTGAFNVPTSVLHDDTYWQLLEDVSNIQDAEPGVSAAWAPILVARNVVLALPDITALSSLDTGALVVGQQFSVGSYLPNTSTGSCLLRWRPDLPKSRHDGVLFFSLTVPMFTGTDTVDYRNGVGETDPGGNGVMELVRGEIIYSVTSLIPSYYPTLQESIVDLDGRLQSTGDVVISHRIEAGHRPTLGVVLANKDYSRHRLVADDAEVLVAESFPIDGHFLFCENGTAPRLSFLVNMDGKSAQDGAIYMLRRGHVRIDDGCGAIYSGTYALHLNQCSSAIAHNGVFHHAVQAPEFLFAPAAVQVQRSSELTAEFLDCTDSGNYAVTIRRMSTANIRNCDGRRAATKGLYVIRSRCFFQFSDFSEAGEQGVLSDQCSQLSGDDCITDNCGAEGMLLQNGTTGDLRGGSSSGNGADGVKIVASGVIDMNSRTCDGNANDGLNADRGSQVNHRHGSTNNNGRFGTVANEVSTVNRRSGTSTGNTGNDLHVDLGSTIGARQCETTSGAGAPDVSDTPVGSFNAISARGVIYS